MAPRRRPSGKTARNLTPYIHWFRLTEKDAQRNEDLLFLRPSRPKLFDRILKGTSPSEKTIPGSGEEKSIPMPADMRNLDWLKLGVKFTDPWPDIGHWANALPKVESDTIIVGVIDSGIPLGHRIFRDKDGRSRIISSWQQSARWIHNCQPWLPFGEEWNTDQIENLLTAHSHPSALTGRLDQEAFAIAARLIERDNTRGQRDLDHRVSHGAHVAGLAAGADPATDPDFARRVKIIAINMPPQILHGSAGAFLQFYASYGVRRVVAVAKALAEKNGHALYPTYVNLSYGMLAGPRDGAMPLENHMLHLKHARRTTPKAKTLEFSLPAGNDNLARRVALVDVPAHQPTDLPPLRVLPADATSGFVEMWISGDDVTLDDLVVSVTPPRTPREDFALTSVSQPGYDYYDIPPKQSGETTPFARLYAISVAKLGPWYTSKSKVHLVLAIAPTSDVDPTTPVAPCGIWHISVQSQKDCQIGMAVQSDQSFFVHSRQGRQAYFDDPEYRRFTLRGDVLDSYDYPCPTHGSCATVVGPSPVTRHGTINALSSHEELAAIGGHTDIGGRPAVYSSTAMPETSFRPTGQVARAYPSEDTHHLFGVLGPGCRDGAAVRLRGTSASCGMATRAKVVTEVTGVAPVPLTYPDAAQEKIGQGRYARTDTQKVARVPKYY